MVLSSFDQAGRVGFCTAHVTDIWSISYSSIMYVSEAQIREVNATKTIHREVCYIDVGQVNGEWC